MFPMLSPHVVYFKLENLKWILFSEKGRVCWATTFCIMGECVNFFIALMSMISTGCIGGALHSTEFIDVNNQVWVAVGFVTLIAKFVICKTYIDEKEAAIRQKGHRDYAGQYRRALLHDVLTLSASLALCKGNSALDSSHKGPVILNFDAFVIVWP